MDIARHFLKSKMTAFRMTLPMRIRGGMLAVVMVSPDCLVIAYKPARPQLPRAITYACSVARNSEECQWREADGSCGGRRPTASGLTYAHETLTKEHLQGANINPNKRRVRGVRLKPWLCGYINPFCLALSNHLSTQGPYLWKMRLFVESQVGSLSQNSQLPEFWMSARTPQILQWQGF